MSTLTVKSEKDGKHRVYINKQATTLCLEKDYDLKEWVLFKDAVPGLVLMHNNTKHELISCLIVIVDAVIDF